LLEEVECKNDHGAAKVVSAQEVEPWAFMHLFSQGFFDGQDLFVASTLVGVGFALESL
jgi:hypothetical protein